MLFHNIWAFIWMANQTLVNNLIQNMYKKVNKTIGLLHKLQNDLPRAPLATIFKGYIQIMEMFYLPNV